MNNIELKNMILKNESFKNLNEIKISENILSNLIEVNISKTGLVNNQNKDLCLNDLINREKIVLNNLELLENDKKLELAIIQEKLYKENIKPDLNLSYGLDTVTDKLFTNESKVSYGAFVSADIELPTANKQQGNLYEVEKTKLFLEKEKDRITHNQSSDYLNARENYNSKLALKKHYEEVILPNIRENIKKSQISFKEGKTSIFSLISSQQNLIDSEIELINILHEYQQSIIELRKAGNCL